MESNHPQLKLTPLLTLMMSDSNITSIAPSIMSTTSPGNSTSSAASMTYNSVAVAIFGVVSFTFLFPCNRIVPLDRRTVAILGATLCYITRAFLFPNRQMDIITAIDFDVLVLLVSIMAINHIVVHLKETNALIRYMQQQIKDHPLRGFWLMSGAAFLIAPLLTNDGVCLLFVEIILNAFGGLKMGGASSPSPLTIPAAANYNNNANKNAMIPEPGADRDEAKDEHHALLMSTYLSSGETTQNSADIVPTEDDSAGHPLMAPKIYYLLYFSPSVCTPSTFLPFVTTDFAVCHQHTSRGGGAKAGTFASRGAAELKLAKKISLLPADFGIASRSATAYRNLADPEQGGSGGGGTRVGGGGEVGTLLSINPPQDGGPHKVPRGRLDLRREDAVYFLLALACSANIGSALTYTGNPQNMIVAQDAISVMSPLKFTTIMFVPAVVSWLLTTAFIQWCWMGARATMDALAAQRQLETTRAQLLGEEASVLRFIKSSASTVRGNSNSSSKHSRNNSAGSQEAAVKQHQRYKSESSVQGGAAGAGAGASSPLINNASANLAGTGPFASPSHQSPHKPSALLPLVVTPMYPLGGEDGRRDGGSTSHRRQSSSEVNGAKHVSRAPAVGAMAPSPLQLSTGRGVVSPSAMLSPRRRRAREQEAMMKKIAHIIRSPFPYMMIILLFAMFVMIFVNVMSIAGLVCVTAVVMVTTLVVGNIWMGQEVWGEVSTPRMGAPDGINESPSTGKLTFAERIESSNDFFESLFGSLDYSLLLIFLGTFIVVANVDSTGIPHRIWGKIVGNTPFNTASSVMGICVFVLVTSQLLGNVAVVQLAMPNVEVLGPTQKEYAWAVISFVATVGGNLTITGSAANIIVAEKAVRLDPDSAIDFFKHYKVCFWVTLFCCVLGGGIITLIVSVGGY